MYMHVYIFPPIPVNVMYSRYLICFIELADNTLLTNSNTTMEGNTIK